MLKTLLKALTKFLTIQEGFTFEGFIKDSKTIDAVIRNFEIIGEAANRLPEDFKDKHNEVDWHRIRGFRNRIVHHYFGIDYSIVWEIKESYLPSLIGGSKIIINSCQQRDLLSIRE